jgi:hypothetical protein
MSDDTSHFDRDEVGKMTHKVSIGKAEVKREKGMYVLMHPIRNLPNCHPKRHADDGRTPSLRYVRLPITQLPSSPHIDQIGIN